MTVLFGFDLDRNGVFTSNVTTFVRSCHDFIVSPEPSHEFITDDRCDYAATSPCDHDCLFGGGLAQLFPDTGESPSVLRLDGTGYVATPAAVTNFPSAVFSITLWVRAASPLRSNGDGVVLSYTVPYDNTRDPGDSELLLHDLNDLRLLVHGKYVNALDRYDGPGGGDLSGIRTGINVARDEAWHHVAVAWRSADGKVDAYLDGARVFDGGPYKSGAKLVAEGKLTLGQPSTNECTALSNATSDTLTAGEPTEESTTCDMSIVNVLPGGLMADVQHLRIWSKFVTADEVAQQMHEPFDGNSIGQVGTGTRPHAVLLYVATMGVAPQMTVLDASLIAKPAPNIVAGSVVKSVCAELSSRVHGVL